MKDDQFSMRVPTASQNQARGANDGEKLPSNDHSASRNGLGAQLQRWRVPLGFACGAAFILLAQPDPRSMIAGGIVAALGLLTRAWASGHIRKNAALATSGPYSYTRNPLYFGSFLLGLGFTIAAGRAVLGLLFVAFFLGIYLPVMRVEEATMRRLFGAEYDAYARAVPLFFPRPTTYASRAATNFDFQLYMRHREYRAALGFVIAWAALALKAMWMRGAF